MSGVNLPGHSSDVVALDKQESMTQEVKGRIWPEHLVVVQNACPPFLANLPPAPPKETGFWHWIKSLFGYCQKPQGTDYTPVDVSLSQERRDADVLAEPIRDCLVACFDNASKRDFLSNLADFGLASRNRQGALFGFIVRTLYPHKPTVMHQQAIFDIMTPPDVAETFSKMCQEQCRLLATGQTNELNVVKTILKQVFNSCGVLASEVDGTVYEAAFQALAGTLLGHAMRVNVQSRLSTVAPPTNPRMPVATEVDLKQLLQEMRSAAANDAKSQLAHMKQLTNGEIPMSFPQWPANVATFELQGKKKDVKRLPEDLQFSDRMKKHQKAIDQATSQCEVQELMGAATRRFRPWMAWRNDISVYLAARRKYRLLNNRAMETIQYADQKTHRAFVKKDYNTDHSKFAEKQKAIRDEITKALLADVHNSLNAYAAACESGALPDRLVQKLEAFQRAVELTNLDDLIVRLETLSLQIFEYTCYIGQAKDKINQYAKPEDVALLKTDIQLYEGLLGRANQDFKDQEPIYDNLMKTRRMLDNELAEAIKSPVDERQLAANWRAPQEVPDRQSAAHSDADRPADAPREIKRSLSDPNQPSEAVQEEPLAQLRRMREVPLVENDMDDDEVLQYGPH
jgi:hypothetical protein